MSPIKCTMTLAGVLIAALSFADFTPLAAYTADTSYDRSLQPLLVNQFDPSLGTLVAIRLRYYQRVNGTLQYEITNPNPSPIGEWTGFQPITTTVQAIFPNGSKYTQHLGLVKAFEGGKFDGTIDYGGTSGGATLLSATGGGSGDVPAFTYRIQNPAVLTSMTGLGMATVNLTNSASLSPVVWVYGSNPFPTYTQLNLGGSSVSIGIIYEYTPNP